MNPSLPPQLSTQRSSERWASERSVASSSPSCSFEIKRPRSPSTMRSGRSAVALPQSVSHPNAAPQPETIDVGLPVEPSARMGKSSPNHPVFDQGKLSTAEKTPTQAPASEDRSEDIGMVPMRLPDQPHSAPVMTATTAPKVVSPQSVPHPRPLSPYPDAQKATITVQPFIVQQDLYKEPSLPRLKQVQLSPHRHSHNPVFPLSLLQDIATIVEDWQAQLEDLHEQIQAIYLDGPIVDGWLEAEATLDGVIQGYRLCGLDERGQMWARPCPADQLPSVSTAIARYQHLRQILAQKQSLEVRFQQLGETLAMVRSSL